ncbi:MAG TPA: hypothetical protein PLK34_03040 [Candidatus Pacearchaeota archaeon]|nr:hypothetical protein [Candidatus Pacearchaeota archaeon]
MKKRGALEISFGWLFAIIAGAVILFLAIFLSARIMGVGQKANSAQAQKGIGNLLELFESSFESSQEGKMDFTVETRIYNRCDNLEYFGEQLIGVTQKSFRKWPDAPMKDEMTSFQNKYIFSETVIEGRKFSAFSKPFEFPFKVTDLVYLIPSEKKYCFISTPSTLKSDFSKISPENIIFSQTGNDCSSDSINVCFSSQKDCEIQVSYSKGQVLKKGKTMHFDSDTLMYAAIFSESQIYECQVQRLMVRANELLGLYLKKSETISKENCLGLDLSSKLIEIKSHISGFKDSSDLDLISNLIQEANKVNQAEGSCALW